MDITKKIRFEVLKRDSFTCQYCGSKTPDVLLEVDHIIPKSKRGSDSMDNLVTACFDCNRGKSAIELNCIPETLDNKIKLIKEKRKQYLQYKRLIKKQNEILFDEISEIDDIYNSFFNAYCISDNFKRTSLTRFIKELGVEEVKDAMLKSCDRFDENNSLKYFCGICWNKIKGVNKNKDNY